MTALLLFLSMLFAAPFQNSGVIEGVVTRFGTTEGLASVRITITRDGQEELSGEPDAVTDATGHFAIRNAAPGAYTLRAARAGYISPMQDGKEMDEGGSSKKIKVDLAQATIVKLGLSPGAAIAGRVVDPLGRPADGATIEASLILPDGSTKTRRAASSDDRGQYRLWGLEAGRYRLSLEYRRGGAVFADFGGGIISLGATPLGISESWIKTYFPGTIDVERAAFVDVPEGSAAEGIDFGFQTGQAFKISGTVIDPGRDKRSGVPDFYLIPLVAGEAKVLEPPRMIQNPMAQTRTPGAFELRGVRPGRYLLYAEDWQVEPRGDNFVVSQVVLDVTSDLTDVTLVMGGTSIVEGIVRNAAQQPAGNVRVALIPPEEMRGHPMFYKEVKTDVSGRFTIKGVMPGDYTIYAIDPATFKDSPAPNSMYGLPAFLTAYQQQGVSVRTRVEERITVSISPLVRQP